MNRFSQKKLNTFLMAPRSEFTEAEKLKIITLVNSIGNEWTRIGREVNHPAESCRCFYNRYLKRGTLSPKRGRPPTITPEKKSAIVEHTEQQPLDDLRSIGDEFDVSHSSVKTILNENKIKFHQQIARVPLTPVHMTNRQNFCNGMLASPQPNIIFTDESTVEVNLKQKGIWRRRGFYPPGSFYDHDAHPISVMVWGGIGPRGYRTPLLNFKGRVNTEKYITSLLSNNIVPHITSVFGNNWTWQQDNARPHTAFTTQYILRRIMPNSIPWPAKSPDLSPIEQVWDYIKKRLRGQTFADADQLFEAIRKEWDEIPNEVLHSIYSSFQARLYVCSQNNGQNLNGHWKQVHNVHDTYRTELHYYTDPNTNKTYVYDI